MAVVFQRPVMSYSTSVREVDLGNGSVGGQNFMPFCNTDNSSYNKSPLVAVQIFAKTPQDFPAQLKNAFGDFINDPVAQVQFAVECGADIVVVKFNIETSEEIEDSCNLSTSILNSVSVPVILVGPEKRGIDNLLIPALAQGATRKCTFGIADESNYKDVAPAVIKNGHNIIARTPIDINLAKQMNILLSDIGCGADNILIDPNIGGLGYGLDYAYSVIERIRIAGLDGDTMLNMPIIVFAGDEAWKAKESKSQSNTEVWGDVESRGLLWESLTATSMLSAGADIVVVLNPEAVKGIKAVSQNVYSTGGNK